MNALWPFNRAELGAKISIEINIEGSVKFCNDKGLQEFVIDWARQCLFDGLSLPVVVKLLQHLLALLGDVLQLSSAALRQRLLLFEAQVIIVFPLVGDFGQRPDLAIVPETDASDAVLAEVTPLFRQPEVFGLITVLNDEDVASNSNTTKHWEARSVDRDSRVEQSRLHEHQLDFGLVFVVSLLANVSIDF